MANACPFCSIVSGDAPSFQVMEDASTMAFLDVKPLFEGHVLVVPRAHHETLADLPSAQVEALFRVVRRLSAVVPAVLGAEGTFVAVNNRVSQSVPHLHVHVVPRRRRDGLRGFFWPRTRYGSEADALLIAGRLAAGYTAHDGTLDT